MPVERQVTNLELLNLLRRVTDLENAPDSDSPLLTVNTNAARSLDTPFAVDNLKDTLGVYTVELTVQAGLLAAQTMTVSLQHGTDSPDTTIDEAFLSSNQLLGLASVGIQTKTRQQLAGVIPANHVAQLTSSGSGSATLVNSTELMLR